MSETGIDPTFYPPNWQNEFDSEQHKVSTERGVIEFVENIVHEEIAKFRAKEAWLELPETAREFREAMQKEADERRRVKVEDYSLPAEYEVLDLAAATASEVRSGNGICHGFSVSAAGTVSLFDSNSGAGTTPLLVATSSPVWLDRGIKFRRGLYVSCSVAATVTVYVRDTED